MPDEKKIDPVWEALIRVFGLIGLPARNIPSEQDKNYLLSFLKKYYFDFKPDEIEMAFELALVGTVEAEVECYGDFTCKFIANVLNGYRRWQKKFYPQEIKTSPMPPQPEIKEDLSDKAMQDWWRQLKQQVMADKHYEVLFIPPMIFDWLDKKNMIRTTNKIRWSYLRRAVDLWRAILFRNSEEHGNHENIIRFKNFVEAQKEKKIPGDEVENVKILAKKILLLDLIRSGQMWNIDFSEKENAGRRTGRNTPFLPPGRLRKEAFMYDWYMSPSEG
jgi:hypothetical protein